VTGLRTLALALASVSLLAAANAEYVAAQFQQAGLKPAGEQGSWIQSVELIARQLDESQSSLALRTGAGTKQIKLGDDAIIGTGVDPASSLDADLVFVGYGLKIPAIKHNDFAGIQTKGKIAVYIAGAPPAAHDETLAQRWPAMKKAGIIGTISIANPNHMDLPWERSAANRFLVTMQLADPKMPDTPGDWLSIAWNPAHADELLGGTGHTFKEIVDLAEAGKPLPHFAIDTRVQVKTVVKRSGMTSQNIAAIYPGTSKSNEYVAVSAHMDNASGVATMLEIANRLHEGKVKTARSILFVVVTGEGKGLLGEKYFEIDADTFAQKFNELMQLTLQAANENKK